LIFLRRILRILHRSIRTRSKPLSMPLHVWVVRRTLVGNVYRHINSHFACRPLQRLEVLQRPQLRVNRLVSAFLSADRPRAAPITWRRSSRIVLSLTLRASDPVNLRERKTEEAHPRSVPKPIDAISKRSVPARVRRARSP